MSELFKTRPVILAQCWGKSLKAAVKGTPMQTTRIQMICGIGRFVGFHFDEFGKISFQSHVRNPYEYWSIWSQRLHQVFCCRNSSSSKSSTLLQLLAELVRSKRWFWMKGWAACLPVDPLRSQKGSSTSKSKSCFAEGMAGWPNHNKTSSYWTSMNTAFLLSCCAFCVDRRYSAARKCSLSDWMLRHDAYQTVDKLHSRHSLSAQPQRIWRSTVGSGDLIKPGTVGARGLREADNKSLP
jgi:hypothetical protein